MWTGRIIAALLCACLGWGIATDVAAANPYAPVRPSTVT